MTDRHHNPDDVRKIDAICDRFEDLCKSDANPRIEDFLDEIASSLRPTLLRELIQIEISYCRARSDVPWADEYRERFPKDVDVVEAALRAAQVVPSRDGVHPFESEPSPPIPSSGEPTLPEPGSALPTPHDFPVEFGDYVLTDEIARGGMGVVYKAQQKSLNRTVALKMILAGNFATLEAVARFRTEAEAAANLDHPGIVPVFEVGEFQGQQFFSMGFVPGQSLQHKIKDGPLPPRAAATLMCAVANAVEYAHEQGIIHRDLKPSNILLDHGGQPKVTDFGLAKQTQVERTLTNTGQILGTPSYMPPEQAGGATEINRTSDVYSLGATLYCLLTGHPPFQAANLVETLRQVAEEQPSPPRSVNPAIPLDLETICLKCLEKKQASRYATAIELADDLQRYLRDEPIVARRVGRIERGWRWIKRHPARAGVGALAFLLSLTTVGLLVAYLYQSELSESLDRETQLRIDLEATNAKLDRALYARRIDSAVAAIAAGNTEQAVRLLRLCPKSHRDWEWHFLHRQCLPRVFALTRAASRCVSLRYSRDGQAITTFSTNGSVTLWDHMTGKLIKTHQLGRPRVPAGHHLHKEPQHLLYRTGFSRDGAHLIHCYQKDSPKIWEVATGKRRAALDGQYVRVALSQNGELVAAIREGGTKLDLWNAKGNKLRDLVVDSKWQIVSAAFSPNGRRLAIVGGDIDFIMSKAHGELQILDVETGMPIVSVERLPRLTTAVAFSDDGTRVACGSLDRKLRLIDATTGRILHICDARADFFYDIRFFPSGNKVAALGADGLDFGNFKSTQSRVAVWNTHTGQREVTLSTNGICMDISPDGKRIAVADLSSDGETIQIWNAATDGPDHEFRVEGRSVDSVIYAPDGKWFATACSSEQHNTRIIVWDAITGRRRVAFDGHNERVGCMSVSPDGNRILSCDDGGTTYLWKVVSGRLVRSYEDAPHAAFLPDGTHVVYGKHGHGKATMSIRDSAGRTIGRPKEVDVARGMSPSTDGSEFLVWDRYDLEMLDRKTGKVRHAVDRYTVEERGSIAAQLSPSGESVVVGDSDTNAYVYDVSATAKDQGKRTERSKGLLMHTLVGHVARVSCVAFGAGGRRIATGSADRTVKLWDAETGVLLLTLKGHSGSVNCIVFSRDGKKLVSGDSNGNVRIWNADSGQW